MKIIHPNPAHRNSRITLVASGFEHSNFHDNHDEKHLISLYTLTNEMTHFLRLNDEKNELWKRQFYKQDASTVLRPDAIQVANICKRLFRLLDDFF